MLKGLYHFIVITCIIISMTAVKAALLLWVANLSSDKNVHLLDQPGTMTAWTNCVDASSNYNFALTECDFRASKFFPDSVSISNIAIAPIDQCPVKRPELDRAIMGTLRNTTKDIHLSYIGWQAVYPEGKVIGGNSSEWLRPLETRSQCLITIRFETKADALEFDMAPASFELTAKFERGVQANDIKT